MSQRLLPESSVQLMTCEGRLTNLLIASPAVCSVVRTRCTASVTVLTLLDICHPALLYPLSSVDVPLVPCTGWYQWIHWVWSWQCSSTGHNMRKIAGKL